MKFIILSLLVMLGGGNVFAQDAVALLKTAQDKTYNPKMRGLKDLVVDLVNPQLTKQLNDQMIFGRLNEVLFRFYWTAQPERVAIEILGLPEGFREIKEELKASMLGRLESVIPIALEKKFEGYQFKLHSSKPQVVVAIAQNGLLPIPEFELNFAPQGLMTTLVAKKPIGLMTSNFTWAQAPWSAGQSYVTQVTTRAEDGPQLTESASVTAWQVVGAVGVPASVKSRTVQTLKLNGSNEKPIQRVVEETIIFKNYKVNVGEAMKWFLGNNTAVVP